MKKSWQKTLCGVSIFFFTFAVFCCSICNLAQASVSSAQSIQHTPLLASTKIHHPCCPYNSSSSHNDKKCQDTNSSPLLQPEKLSDLWKSVIFQVSKLPLHFNNVISDLSNAALTVVSYQSLPKLLQKSVPIYLFNRVLRI